jgi:hypothetical protein
LSPGAVPGRSLAQIEEHAMRNFAFAVLPYLAAASISGLMFTATLA